MLNVYIRNSLQLLIKGSCIPTFTEAQTPAEQTADIKKTKSLVLLLESVKELQVRKWRRVGVALQCELQPPLTQHPPLCH